MWALKAAGLKYAYPGLELFNDLDLKLRSGEARAILGPSGSGKTTLVHLLAGILKPSAGQIWWGDLEITQLSEEKLARLRRSQVGLIFQHHYLLNELNALENVMVPGLISGVPDQRRGLELLAAVGLESKAKLLPVNLSGGERQRIAVARALYAKPRIILADEPTGSLDRANAELVRDLLTKLARESESAIIFATHDSALVKDWPIWRLENGRLV